MNAVFVTFTDLLPRGRAGEKDGLRIGDVP